METPNQQLDAKIRCFLTACKSIAKRDENKSLQLSIKSFGKLYNHKPTEIVSQLSEVYQNNRVDILDRDYQWLSDEEEEVLIGDLNISKIYLLASSEGSSSDESTEQLAIQYHLTSIFKEIKADNEGDVKVLSEIVDVIKYRLKESEESESESESETEESEDDEGPSNPFDDMDFGNTFSKIFQTVTGNLGDMGIELPEGTSMPPPEMIGDIVRNIANNPSTKRTMKKITKQVRKGGAVEDIFANGDVQSLIKGTLKETMENARSIEHPDS